MIEQQRIDAITRLAAATPSGVHWKRMNALCLDTFGPWESEGYFVEQSNPKKLMRQKYDCIRGERPEEATPEEQALWAKLRKH